MLAAALVPAAARALPGQTVVQFTTWAAQRPLLRGIQRGTDEMSGWPSFSLLTADHGVAWSVTVHADGTAIRAESLGVSDAGGAPGSEPVRHDGAGYGFTFFRSLYGNGNVIANDFRTAHLAASFTDPASKGTTQFYRGALYGYQTSSGYVTVETLRAFAQDLAEMRRCTARPGDCTE
jgi:hypothetical protein